MIRPRGLRHIGIAVRSIEACRNYYEQVLGARFEGTAEVPSQQVRVAFLVVGSPGREVRLELIEATSPDTGVARFVERYGDGLHHLAFDVDDLAERLAELKAEGIRLIDEHPREGGHGTRIAFLHPKSSHGVLTELCESEEDMGRPGGGSSG